MIEISLFVGVAVVSFGWLLFRLVVYIKNKQVVWKHEAVQLLFLINLIVLYRITFHPFAKVDGEVQPLIFDIATAWPFRVNLIPFVNLLKFDSKRDLLLNLIGNVTMFIPTGIMTPLIYRKLDSFKKTMLTGICLSLAIEIIQLPFAVRASDIDDLILNTVGCLIGCGILALIRLIKKGLTQTRRNGILLCREERK